MTIPAGFGQALFVFSGTSLPLGAAVTLGFENQTPQTASECAFDLHQAMRDVTAAILATETYLERTDVKLGPDATGPIGTFSQLQAGGRTGGAVPPNVSLLVRKTTAIGGRQGRGRLFMPGMSEEDVTESGAVTSTLLDAASAAWGVFFAALVADGLPPYLLHDGAMGPTAITVFNTDGRVATQRRRLRR